MLREHKELLSGFRVMSVWGETQGGPAFCQILPIPRSRRVDRGPANRISLAGADHSESYGDFISVTKNIGTWPFETYPVDSHVKLALLTARASIPAGVRFASGKGQTMIGQLPP